MPLFKARIEIWLKEGLVDAEGQTVKEALNDLGYPIMAARVGKVYQLIIEAVDKKAAEKTIDELCRRLLANPVKDRYYFEVSRY
ncbi:MAG: phosphoribosylformylglycinamidine synthase subunit PurS [Thermoprotei archaeon]|nr:phosphoribosylformylglycinamidine synthase subunit PurS [Thermoprotei archaeon]